jgi:hypothetical protein
MKQSGCIDHRRRESALMALKRATMGEGTKFTDKRQRDRRLLKAARKVEREQSPDRIDPALRLLRPVKAPP